VEQAEQAVADPAVIGAVLLLLALPILEEAAVAEALRVQAVADLLAVQEWT
jgi:hypothetical protein